MTKLTTPSIVVPSFVGAARAMLGALRAADKAASKCAETTAMAVQKWLDECAVAGVPRDQHNAVKAIGKTVRECQVFVDAIASGTLEKKTVTEYAQGAMRAYWHNVPFTASLKNDPAFKIPDASGNIKSGGAVVRTTREALFKTLNKALEQMRILEEHDAAAACLDTILEYFDGFTETETATV